MVGPFDRVFGQFHVAAVREESALFVGEVVEQDRREPEDGDRDPGDGEGRQRACRASRRPSLPRDSRRGSRRTSRSRAAPTQSEKVAGIPSTIRSSTGSAVFVGDQFAGEDLLHHRQVLLRQRLIEAPFLRRCWRPAAGVAFLPAMRCAGAEFGITLKISEDDHRDREKHSDHADQAPEDEAGHQTAVPSRLGQAGVRLERGPSTVGSSASRSPSPKTFSESTVSRIIMPGMIASSGVAGDQFGSGGDHRAPGGVGRLHTDRRGTRAPTSSSMLLAMLRAKKTMIVEPEVGQQLAEHHPQRARRPGRPPPRRTPSRAGRAPRHASAAPCRAPRRRR